MVYFWGVQTTKGIVVKKVSKDLSRLGFLSFLRPGDMPDFRMAFTSYVPANSGEDTTVRMLQEAWQDKNSSVHDGFAQLPEGQRLRIDLVRKKSTTKYVDGNFKVNIAKIHMDRPGSTVCTQTRWEVSAFPCVCGIKNKKG